MPRIVDETRERFAMVSESDFGLVRTAPPSALVAWLALKLHSNPSRGDSSFPSWALLQRVAGIQRSQLAVGLRWLRSNGYLRVQRRGSLTSVYFLTRPETRTSDVRKPGPTTSGIPGPTTSGNPGHRTDKVTDEVTSPSREAPSDDASQLLLGWAVDEVRRRWDARDDLTYYAPTFSEVLDTSEVVVSRWRSDRTEPLAHWKTFYMQRTGKKPRTPRVLQADYNLGLAVRHLDPEAVASAAAGLLGVVDDRPR